MCVEFCWRIVFLCEKLLIWLPCQQKGKSGAVAVSLTKLVVRMNSATVQTFSYTLDMLLWQ
jgi:hypothetical protein